MSLAIISSLTLVRCDVTQAGTFIFCQKEVITMSLDKAIQFGKEKRKPYIGSKAVDHTCRNHGSCPWCRGNRTYKDKKYSLSK